MTKVVTHIADALVEAVERCAAPICVGIDPVASRLPPALRPRDASRETALAAIRSFVLGVLDAVATQVPCVKLQSACFERFGHRGVAVLESSIREARARGLQVILDAKRGDIGISAEHYAAAAFGAGDDDEDRPGWITVNAYLGEDGIRPFLENGGGAFALVRTSNPGGDAVQGQRLADGRTVAESVAAMIAMIGRDHLGARGYSALGAVVGATKADDAAALRARMPQQILLLPGVGTQGGRVDDLRPCFGRDGVGALVTASRSVIYADATGDDWRGAVTGAARALADEVGRAAGLR